ncbi:stage II sporulation protein M [Paenibacillus sediminis]|uniref:Stage II sporulation protein M n=1 Tax=Paenibacillus sediminis TaxID=664909 RepID=A0ABS4GZL1_9BACL|nr:stage II sporulation protein M [Paenibacillus sediminis]MBP1935694.1 stage II sporulation protein M [Paenibacillus sediminis]
MQSLRNSFKDQTSLYIFVSVLFLVGVVFGALMVNALSLEQQQDLGRYLGNFFVTVDQGLNPVQQEAYWDIALAHLKWIGLIWILGFSVIGLPVILILDFLKGVLIGFTVGYLVGQYSWKGLLFALVAVAPHNFIIIPVFIISSVCAMTFSLYIIKNRVLMQKHGSIKQPFMSYTGLTAAMMLMILAVSTFETWVTPAMMRWVTPLLL